MTQSVAQPERVPLLTRIRQSVTAVLVIIFPAMAVISAVYVGARTGRALLSAVSRLSELPAPADDATPQDAPAYPGFLRSRFFPMAKRIRTEVYEPVRTELESTRDWWKPPPYQILGPVRWAYSFGWSIAVAYVLSGTGVAITVQFVIGPLLMGAQAVAFGAARAADSVVAALRRIRTVCPHESCWKELSRVEYLCPCPECDIVHDDLVPNRDGVLWHVCAGCGWRLPTTILLGRHRLRSRCPSCHRGLPQRTGRVRIEPLPIAAGPDAGKTTFLALALQELLDDPPAGVRVEISDPAQLAAHKQRMQDLQHDGTRPTQMPMPSGLVADVRHPRGGGRIVSLFDAAGEYFTSAGNAARLGYLRHIRALLVIVDPLTMRGLGDALSHFDERPKSRPGAGSREDATTRSVLEAAEQLGHRRRKFVLDRVAVVVTKADLLDNSAVGRPRDEVVERWLNDNGMRSMVSVLAGAAHSVRYLTSDLDTRSGGRARGEVLLWLADARPARQGPVAIAESHGPGRAVVLRNLSTPPLGYRIGRADLIGSYAIGVAAVPAGIAALVWWAVTAIF